MKKISIIKRDAENNDVEFWRTKTSEERLSAVEFLREQFYIIQGYDRPPSIIREITIRDSTSEIELCSPTPFRWDFTGDS